MGGEEDGPRRATRPPSGGVRWRPVDPEQTTLSAASPPPLDATTGPAAARSVEETTLSARDDPREIRETGREAADETILRSDVAFRDADDAAAEVVHTVLSGGHVGRFVVLRELGRGAMGVVLAAYDEELDRKVAIKLLHASRGANPSLGRAMLLREAQAMARLAHPNVVAVHEVGVIEGAVFVAMEYVAGVDLQRWLAERRRPWREVVAILRQAGEGLAAAHREGLVHRDFKPSNVLVGDDGRVRVADFGLAARRGAAASSAARSEITSLTATLAPEGALVGTPVYMAPELLRGASATALSDQYAFCVALWEALYGARPFEGDTLASLTEAVEGRDLPAPPTNSEVPPWLHAALTRGLARSPERRHPSLAALVELLARDPEQERRLRRRRALQIAAVIAATATLVALLVLALSALRRMASERQAEARLISLRTHIGELRGRGEGTEAARLLADFVALPENRGLTVVARAHLEWAAAEPDDAVAADAYTSAYIAARTDADGHAALRGLVERLNAQGRHEDAAAALAVLAREAPAELLAPALRDDRLAAALVRRDLASARAVLAEDDPDGLAPVLAELARVTTLPEDRFAPNELVAAAPVVLDHDGDGRDELILWARDAPLRTFRADLTLAPLTTVDLGDAMLVSALAPVEPGEPLLFASYAAATQQGTELRFLRVAEGGAPELIASWTDSHVVHPRTVDLDRDGRPEVYLGTEAYARRLWRLDRAADGSWSRRSAHPPTEATASDITEVVALDLDADGRLELAATVGPWRAYDVRIFRPKPDGTLDQIARRAFGSLRHAVALRAPEGDLLAFVKMSDQIAPGRFPPDKPLGEPDGLYVLTLRDGALEIVGHVPLHADQRARRLHAADLDGDGRDELVVELLAQGMMVLRPRPGAPLRPYLLAGLRPLVAHDFDADGRAEVLARSLDRTSANLLLGVGDQDLPALPDAKGGPRPIPAAIQDPVIADAWTRAEQMVSVGARRRSAAELSAIARLSGQVAPDMFLRAGELYAELDELDLAAEHFAVAAARPDLAAQALAGAALARRRRGEFQAAAALTRQRLALADEPERPALAAELAALESAAAPRPELALTFERPLDPRWRISAPLAMARLFSRQTLSLWSDGAPIAELPLEWDGGPLSIELELDLDRVEWGTTIAAQLLRPDGQPWISAAIRGRGVSEQPSTELSIFEGARVNFPSVSAKARRSKIRASVYPGLGTIIRDYEPDTASRLVGALLDPTPPPGPLRLRITSELVEPGFVGHVELASIRLRGLSFAEVPDLPARDPALLLAEGEPLAALSALGTLAPDDARRLWRLEALLQLGRLDEAAAEIRALAAQEAVPGPIHDVLRQRLRRGDDAMWLAARAALGPRFIDLILAPGEDPGRHTGEPSRLLAALAPTDPHLTASDPRAAQRLILVDHLRAAALLRAGRPVAAREALDVAYARLDPVAVPGDKARERLLRDQLAATAASGDRDGALLWIRRSLEHTATPYLVLERLRSDPTLSALLGEATWTALAAELRAARH